MSGQWPPDWEDADGDVEAETEQADAPADAGLSEVTAFLAALPKPVLPEDVEARISAAITAEAANRDGAATDAGRTLGRPPRRPRVRRSRRFRVQAISSAVACLVLAGFGYLLTQLGGSSSSSSSAVSAASAPAVGSAPHIAASSSGRQSFSQAIPAPAPAEPSAAASASSGVPFTVTRHGDAYQKSTLVSRVRERLNAGQGLVASGFAGSVSAPSSALIGCVLHVTGNVIPSLVDEATYAGTPVYVIAVPSHAWVVGRGCTASDPELIASVALGGLPGNLGGLGSVEA